jgi:hypothetical protein
MTRFINLLLIIACIVLAVTNPSQDLHRKAVYESVVAANTKHEVLGKIAAGVRGEKDSVLLQYNNYWIFSTTTLDGNTVSVGALSHVWKTN